MTVDGDRWMNGRDDAAVRRQIIWRQVGQTVGRHANLRCDAMARRRRGRCVAVDERADSRAQLLASHNGHT